MRFCIKSGVAVAALCLIIKYIIICNPNTYFDLIRSSSFCASLLSTMIYDKTKKSIFQNEYRSMYDVHWALLVFCDSLCTSFAFIFYLFLYCIRLVNLSYTHKTFFCFCFCFVSFCVRFRIGALSPYRRKHSESILMDS